MNDMKAAPTATVNFDAPYRMTIGGRAVDADATFDVFNPATNAVIAQAPDASRTQLDAAVAAARTAFGPWSSLGWDRRADYIVALADALDRHKDELITLLTTEQGRPRHSMATGEVEDSIGWMRAQATLRLPSEIVEESDEHVVEVDHTPLGVVGAITPWNFPIFLGLWKVAPALLTGNTMVMKPSPFTPLTTLRIGEIAQTILPAGVFNVVSGGNDLGQWMTEHKDIAKISFTGSTATGKKVMASASGTLKRITLELGGNDAAIVLGDTDFEAIIPTLFDGAFGNSAQWCIAIKRLYVHSSIYDSFVAAFVAYARTKIVGDGMDPKTDLGPVQNRMQYDKLRNLFADIKAKGYKVALGGEIDETLAGNFVPVTLIENPPEDSRVVREEPFGPVLPIISFDDVDDVVARANDSDFGLGGSVWSADRKQAIAIARRLETGTVWVNEIHKLGVTIPFGGHKQSGMGVESGLEGLAEFTNTKSLYFRK